MGRALSTHANEATQHCCSNHKTTSHSDWWGEEIKSQLITVEVMDIENQFWLTAAGLPHPYSRASATIYGDQLYMLGGLDKTTTTKSVLTCSLTKLLQSCSETISDSVWHRIADVPVCKSTCAAVNGELVAVGREDAKGKVTSAIHKYNPTTDSWNIISNMPTARGRCLVAVLPTDGVMVVGGAVIDHSLFPVITGKIEKAYPYNIL